MKLISHIAQIDPELEQKGFWNLERLQIMDELYPHSEGKQQLNRSALDRAAPNLVKRLCQLNEDSLPQEKLSEAQKSAINSVLSFLQERGWRVLFYPVQVKKPRRSVIPTDSDVLISWRRIEQWRSQFWRNSSTPLSRRRVTLALILEINHSLGVNHRILKKHALTSLTLHSAIDGFILIPLEGTPNAIPFKLPLNARARLLWAWYLRNVPQPFDSWYKSIQFIRESLKRIYIDSSGGLSASFNIHKVEYLLRVNGFSLIEHGIEPFIVNTLQSDLIPLPPPRHGFGFEPVKDWPRLVQRSRPPAPKPIPVDESTSNIWRKRVSPPSPANTSTIMEAELLDAEILERIGWTAACQYAAQRLTGALRQACIDDIGHYRNQKLNETIVKQILNPLKADAMAWLRWSVGSHSGVPSEIRAINQHIDLLERGFTALDLMITWTYKRLINDQVMVSTLASDLRLVFTRGFFWCSYSARLDDWDDEDVEVLISDHLLVENTKPSSQRKAINLLKRIGEWSRVVFGCFEGVFFPSASGTGSRATWRNHIIGLEEHELLQRKLTPCFVDYCDQVKAVLDLAFYGGLRSGEIANLRLGDIVSSRDELIFYLRAFKTPSARRAIHFHLLAPPEAVERVQTVLDSRQIDYRRYARQNRGKTHITRHDTLLFSLDQRIDEASAIQLVAYARDVLKDWLGDGADLHLGRHSFASHLLLRWYCSRHPELIPELREKDHFAFTQHGRDKLKRYIGEPTSAELAAQCPSSLIHLIKIMGHKTTHTFFRVYVHSFEVIANHALSRAHAIDDEVSLTGHLITELIPGMRSRASQRALNYRSAAVLLTRLNQKNPNNRERSDLHDHSDIHT